MLGVGYVCLYIYSIILVVSALTRRVRYDSFHYRSFREQYRSTTSEFYPAAGLGSLLCTTISRDVKVGQFQSMIER